MAKLLGRYWMNEFGGDSLELWYVSGETNFQPGAAPTLGQVVNNPLKIFPNRISIREK